MQYTYSDITTNMKYYVGRHEIIWNICGDFEGSYCKIFTSTVLYISTPICKNPLFSLNEAKLWRLKCQCYRKSLIIDIFSLPLPRRNWFFLGNHSENNSVDKKAFPRPKYHLQNVIFFSLLIFIKATNVSPNVLQNFYEDKENISIFELCLRLHNYLECVLGTQQKGRNGKRSDLKRNFL